MKSFIMRALTKTGALYTFTLADIPTYINKHDFVLLNKEDSPILNGNSISIGANNFDFYTGDIVSYDNVNYLISYERGFYGINENYVRVYLGTLKGCEVVGNIHNTEFPISLMKKTHLRFKYKNTVFTIRDIVGMYEGKLLLNKMKDCIDPNECKSDVGVKCEGKRLYLGDSVGQTTVTLCDGRVCLVNNATGSRLDLDGKDKGKWLL